MKEYMNASLAPRKRAELLLKEMNLDEKMAQLVGVFAIKGYEDKMAAFSSTASAKSVLWNSAPATAWRKPPPGSGNCKPSSWKATGTIFPPCFTWKACAGR